MEQEIPQHILDILEHYSVRLDQIMNRTDINQVQKVAMFDELNAELRDFKRVNGIVGDSIIPKNTQSTTDDLSTVDKFVKLFTSEKGSCSVSKIAEIVGREYIESQLPSRNNFKVNGIIDNIRQINEGVGGIDSAMDTVASLHGPYKGIGGEALAFIGGVGGTGAFTQSLLQVEQAASQVQSILDGAENIEELFRNLTFQDVAPTLTKMYLRNVKILLPDSVSKSISNHLNEIPLFNDISEAIGSVFYNIRSVEDGVELVDGVMQDVLDATGLSTLLGKDSLLRTIPEYVINMEHNYQIIRRMAMRYMPSCSFGKIFQVVDEAIAHMYDLANDVMGYAHMFDNRQLYIKGLINQYGGLLKLLNNYFPACHQYTTNIPPLEIEYEGRKIMVDKLGNASSPQGSRIPVSTSNRNTRFSDLTE